MTPSQLILMPVFLHVLLLFFLGIRTATARGAAIRSREVRIKEIVLGLPAQRSSLSCGCGSRSTSMGSPSHA
jgi:hypothetical protein